MSVPMSIPIPLRLMDHMNGSMNSRETDPETRLTRHVATLREPGGYGPPYIRSKAEIERRNGYQNIPMMGGDAEKTSRTDLPFESAAL
jgi:hypothetical protein